MQWSTLRLASELRPPWLGQCEVRLPGDWQEPPHIAVHAGAIEFSFDAERAIRLLQEEAWAAPMGSPTLRLPFSYLRLPGWLRLLAAKLVHLPARLHRRQQDPPWPIAPTLDVLADLTGTHRPPLWGSATWAAALTVDVDTVKGLRHALHSADALERARFRGCFYIVGDALRREPGIVRELHQRGHEIGSHGVHHDNRVCFLPPPQQNDRLRRARAYIEPYAGIGFRSPSALRTPQLLAAVARHFEYDSSVCDTDLEHARGCTTIFPYRLHGCLEIPFTLPMDASLAYTGYRPGVALDIWQSKCAYIRALGGLAVLVVHAEPHLARGKRFDAFVRFLAWLQQQSDVTVVQPAEVARRWKHHDEREPASRGDRAPGGAAPAAVRFKTDRVEVCSA